MNCSNNCENEAEHVVAGILICDPCLRLAPALFVPSSWGTWPKAHYDAGGACACPDHDRARRRALETAAAKHSEPPYMAAGRRLVRDLVAAGRF